LADIFDQIAGVSATSGSASGGDIFDQIVAAAEPEQPLSLAEKVMGYSRSYLAGPTFGFADNIEAAIAAPFTDKTYSQELAGIQSEQDRFKDKTDYLDNIVEIGSGAVLNPIGALRTAAKGAQVAASPLSTLLSAPGVKTAVNVATSVPAQGALAAAGASNGENTLENTIKGGLLGVGLSAAGSVAGNVLQKTARGSERLKLSAYGIGSADIARQLKKLDSQGISVADASDVPLLKTLDRAEKQGLINAGDDILKNARGVADKQDELAKSLRGVLNTADPIIPADKNFPLPNTTKFLESLSGKARKVADDAVLEEYTALTDQMAKGSLLDLQKAKIGLNYAHDTNPLSSTVQKALRADLRQAIEDRVNEAATNGLISNNLSGKVKTLNSEWGDLAELRDSFIGRGYKDLQGDVIEDAFGGIRTSGGAGNLNNASATTGNPLWAALGAGLNAARVPESKSAIADVLSDPAIRAPIQAVGDALPEVLSARNSAAQYVNSTKETEKPQTLLERVLQNRAASAQLAEGASISSLVDSVLSIPEANASEMIPTRRNVDPEEKKAFNTKVVDIAKDLEADPADLMAVMKFETGGELSSKTKNRAGSGATGLIQFMPATAKELTGASSKEAAIKILEDMTPTQQLDYVKKHLAPFKGKLNSLDDVYMAVLYPKAVGKDSDYALFKEGTKAYWQNRGLDIDRDGVITKAEAASKVKQYKV
jgi:hypothetical protein